MKLWYRKDKCLFFVFVFNNTTNCIWLITIIIKHYDINET